MTRNTDPIWLPQTQPRHSAYGPGFPLRDHGKATPLILASEMYPALEELALGAKDTLFLAFRIFDPLTATRSKAAKALGLSNWLDILKHRVEAGVTVRLLLTDFEPSFAEPLHSGSWTSFQLLRNMAATLPEASLERFEIIVIPHVGELGWLARQIFRLPAGIAIRRVFAAFASKTPPEEDPLAVRPGLWRYAQGERASPRYKSGPAPRLWPATHHHKFAVADAKTAILGGLDVNERRWETPAYNQPAYDSWHDLSLQIEGPAAGDVAEHFRQLWNLELPRYRDITREWMTGADRKLTVEPLDTMPTPFPPAPALGEATAKIQIARTLSRKNRHPLAFGPRKDVRELMAAHRKLILSARRLLYIEAQFFRSKRAARWIVEAAKRSPALQIIIVLPQAPDEVAFGGETKNPAHQHGEWQQARALGLLRRKLGTRVGLYALGRQQPLTEKEKPLIATRGAAFGAGVIYIHAKLLIADDERALISSANINNRSFNWDSELGCLWEEPSAVLAFRKRLWKQLIHKELDPETAAQNWRDIANENIQRDPQDRQGHILPYRYARVRRFGRPSWFVPDDLV